MKNQNSMKTINLLMIGFYVLGLVAFLLIGDLSTTINKVLFGLFLLLILRESVRYYLKYIKDQK